MFNRHPSEQKRMENGARMYALSQRSDPFAFNRAMSHLENNIAGYRYNSQTGERYDAFYDASPKVVMHKLPDGRVFSDGSNTYPKTEYLDVKVV